MDELEQAGAKSKKELKNKEQEMHLKQIDRNRGKER